MTDSRQILICMCHTQHDMGLYYSNLSSRVGYLKGQTARCTIIMLPASLMAFVYWAAPIARRVLSILLTYLLGSIAGSLVTSPLCVLVPLHQRPSPPSVFINGLLSRRTSLPCTSTRRGQFYISAHRADSPCLHWLDVCL